MSTATARRLPVRTALSGPAAGVIAAAAIARAAGFDNVITCDLGGTSLRRLAGRRRRRPRSPRRPRSISAWSSARPMIEITTIGAGGGSIARSIAAGCCRSGRKAPARVPGPGLLRPAATTRPTLTDANVVLGRINAERPIGGELARLDVEAAQRRDRARMSARRSASTRWRRPRRSCASPTRAWPARSGWSRSSAGTIPRKFVAMPFGGGGALHAGALIKEVGLQARAGAALPRRHLGARLRHRRHAPRPGADGEPRARRARRRGARPPHGGGRRGGARRWSSRPACRSSASTSSSSSTCTIVGQTHTVGGAAAGHAARTARPASARAIVRAAFETAYAAAFSRLLPGHPGAHRHAAHRRDRPAARISTSPRSRRPPDASLDGGARGTRQVWFDGGWHDAQVWSRLELPVGAVIRPGHAGAARRDHVHRARPARPRRRARQPRSSSGARDRLVRALSACRFQCSIDLHEETSGGTP